MEQVGTYGSIHRDEGERVISVAYYALIDLELFDETLCKRHNARWEELDKVGPLIFDHNQMVEDTISILRSKAAVQPLGFNLLPEKFTLPQLQSLYEAIYQTKLDKRNFRKKILEMGILEKQETKINLPQREVPSITNSTRINTTGCVKRVSFSRCDSYLLIP